MHTVAATADYVSVREAAAMLSVDPSTIRRRIEEGSLPAVQLGGPGTAIRIHRDAIHAWLWSAGETRG